MVEIKRKRGRPRKHVTAIERMVAAAKASKAYRERVREHKAIRKKAEVKLVSKIIDLQTSVAEALEALRC